MSPRTLGWLAVATGLPLAGLACAAFVGLGFAREAAPWLISASATGLVFAPPMLAAGVAPRHRRPWILALGLWTWSFALLSLLPIYFPGERADAVATGVALFGLGLAVDPLARAIASWLPPEGNLARPTLSEARPIAELAAPPASLLGDDQIALPFEGEGRRISIPVVFSEGGRTLEAEMTFDTGATYTTLPRAALEKLGASPTEASPVMKLHTANGEREAQLVLLDGVWLGDLQLRGVAVAVCDLCGSGETTGLLGLNVSGAFNMNIDADRREVVFSSRVSFDRHLDIQPFLDVDAWTRQLPGGRIEVGVEAHNASDRQVETATVAVTCGATTWGVELGAVPALGDGKSKQKLPIHEPCERYEIGLERAHW
ncbi:MAG: retropepsin-like domain-containing protein [Deltaproteobacteria bacterium]|nr:retropepsin-like domain-containing protein [Deltaproteobacteria bacterium]